MPILADEKWQKNIHRLQFRGIEMILSRSSCALNYDHYL